MNKPIMLILQQYMTKSLANIVFHYMFDELPLMDIFEFKTKVNSYEKDCHAITVHDNELYIACSYNGCTHMQIYNIKTNKLIRTWQMFQKYYKGLSSILSGFRKDYIYPLKI